MKNFILAITSFLATVILLSQVAFAQGDDGWNPKANAAPGDEPFINVNSGRSNGDPKNTEGSSPDSGENNQNPCVTCKANRAPVKRLGDKTIVNDKAGDDTGGSTGQEGRK